MPLKKKGVAVSPGIAIGKVLKLETSELVADENKITQDQVENEKVRINQAIEAAGAQLNALVAAQEDEEKAEIFTAHLSILEDPYFGDLTMGNIDNLENAEKALQMAVEEIGVQFLALDDEYLRERVADFKDVSSRLMHILQGVEQVDLSELDEEAVIVAKDLSPSQTATMDFDKVLGFATDFGGRTSHTAIMARNMEIPAIVGCQDIFDAAAGGDIIMIDGSTGELELNPEEASIKKYQEMQAAIEQEKERLAQLKNLPAETTDGHRVELCTNAGSQAEGDLAMKKGAEGIGLFRTEFLYMENTAFPTEEQQFTAYKNIVSVMENRPVIIRTLDIGGDKELSYYKFDPELNPFLGYRAIRLCLDRHDIFKAQLRGILLASTFGKIKIMYPMIISVEELQRCNAVLEECKEELKAEGKAFDEHIEVGIMVETPAAVLLAKEFAKYVNFFSIGTNDLTQYTLAVDRGNEKIQNLYNPLHPAVLRGIKQVIDASHEAGIWTGMCGELAGDTRAVPLLLGMGLDEFSMSAASLLKAKEIIRSTSFEKCQKLAEQVLKAETAVEIAELLDNFQP